jgi:hypothetical protein
MDSVFIILLAGAFFSLFSFSILFILYKLRVKSDSAPQDK